MTNKNPNTVNRPSQMHLAYVNVKQKDGTVVRKENLAHREYQKKMKKKEGSLPDVVTSVGAEADSYRESLMAGSPEFCDGELVKQLLETHRADNVISNYERLLNSNSYIPETLKRSYPKMMEKRAAAEEKIEVINREFDDRGGWSRYYLVTGGHLHNDPGCSSLRSTTRLSLIPETSGLDDDQVIEMAGDRTCTICSPDAPVSLLNKKSVLLTPDEKEAAAEKEAERLKQEQKKAEKAARVQADALETPILIRDWDGNRKMVTSRRSATKAINDMSDDLAYNYSEQDDPVADLEAVKEYLRQQPVPYEKAVADLIKKRKAASRKNIKATVHIYRQMGQNPDDVVRDGDVSLDAFAKRLL